MNKQTENNIIAHFMAFHTKESVIQRCHKNEERPFGYVIDWIKDNYSIPKTEGWDCAWKILHKLKMTNNE